MCTNNVKCLGIRKETIMSETDDKSKSLYSFFLVSETIGNFATNVEIVSSEKFREMYEVALSVGMNFSNNPHILFHQFIGLNLNLLHKKHTKL